MSRDMYKEGCDQIISLETVNSHYKLLETEVRHLELSRLKDAYLDDVILPFQYRDEDIRSLIELKQKTAEFEVDQSKDRRHFEAEQEEAKFRFEDEQEEARLRFEEEQEGARIRFEDEQEEARIRFEDEQEETRIRFADEQEEDEYKFEIHLRCKCQEANAECEIFRSHRLEEECAAKIEKLRGRAPITFTYSAGTDLPLEIWENILKKLCSDLELEGVRSASVIARDIINASMACKEVYAAALPALHHLGSSCPSVFANDDKEWDQVASDPCSISEEERFEFARPILGYRRHNFPVKLFTLMRFLGLSQPSRAPARLLRAVLSEKFDPDDSELSRLCKASELITSQTSKAYTNFNFRLTCMQLGFGTSQQLRDVGIISDDGLQALRRAELQVIEAQEAEEQKWEHCGGEPLKWFEKGVLPKEMQQDKLQRLMKSRDEAQREEQQLKKQSLETWDGAEQRREDLIYDHWHYAWHAISLKRCEVAFQQDLATFRSSVSSHDKQRCVECGIYPQRFPSRGSDC